MASGSDYSTTSAPGDQVESPPPVADLAPNGAVGLAAAGAGSNLASLLASQLTTAELQRHHELLASALGYARRGWHVLRLYHLASDGKCYCCAGKKSKSCSSPGKHPVDDDWPHLATTDEATIRQWWTERPLGNIGIAAGQVSGIIAWDVDPRNGGDETDQDLRRQHGMPDTRHHRTGQGGYHLVWKVPPGLQIRNAKGLFGPGIDVKGDGGYFVAPPSVSGYGPYEVVLDADPAPMPQWMLERFEARAAQQRGEPTTLSAPVKPLGLRRKYGLAAIEGEGLQLAKMALHSGRNDALNMAAFRLGQLAPCGVTDEETAWAALRGACVANRLLEPPPAGDGVYQCWRTFQSGWRSGLQAPREPVWREDEAIVPLRPWTGFGLGDRFAEWSAEDLRYCPDSDEWYLFGGGRWARVASSIAEGRAQWMIKGLIEREGPGYDDMAEDGKPSDRQSFKDQVQRWSCSKYAAETVRCSKAHGIMRIDPAACDADPLMINLLNGVWDARAEKFLPHDPDQMLILRADVAYDPEASCPKWLAAVALSIPDEAMRLFWQMTIGYSATADITEQAAFVVHGPGANGKTALYETISRLLGGYARAMYTETLISSATERHPTELAMLRGRRLLLASETKPGKHLDSAKLKQLSGGDHVSARLMRQDFSEFITVGKIHLITNHLPHIDDDPAMWRRIHVIPFLSVIPPEQRIPDLASKLVATEASGILNWILEGIAMWKAAGGLNPPGSAVKAKDDYRRGEDIVGQYIASHLTEAPELKGRAQPPTEVLHRDFCVWFREGWPGRIPMSRSTFGKHLAAKMHSDLQGTYSGRTVWKLKLDPEKITQGSTESYS
jgi:putative DNA primase/helicase